MLPGGRRRSSIHAAQSAITIAPVKGSRPCCRAGRCTSKLCDAGSRQHEPQSGHCFKHKPGCAAPRARHSSALALETWLRPPAPLTSPGVLVPVDGLHQPVPHRSQAHILHGGDPMGTAHGAIPALRHLHQPERSRARCTSGTSSPVSVSAHAVHSTVSVLCHDCFPAVSATPLWGRSCWFAVLGCALALAPESTALGELSAYTSGSSCFSSCSPCFSSFSFFGAWPGSGVPVGSLPPPGLRLRDLGSLFAPLPCPNAACSWAVLLSHWPRARPVRTARAHWPSPGRTGRTR